MMLLPCPHCGGEASVIHDYIGSGMDIARCEPCYAWARLDSWNRRAPAAEPTAGDARDIRAAAEACIPMYGTISTKRAAIVEAVYQALLAQRPDRDELPNVSDLEERLLAFFDQPVHYDAMGFIRTLRAAIEDAASARPSLGAAADAVMAERERCAKIENRLYNAVVVGCVALAGDKTLDADVRRAAYEELDAVREWADKQAAAIRASSPEGSPDGSPDGEGGRET